MGAASTPEHAQYRPISCHFTALMKCKHKEVSLAKKKKKRKKRCGIHPDPANLPAPILCRGGEALAAGIAGVFRQQASHFRTKARKILSRASLVQKGAFPSDTPTSRFFTLGPPQITIFSQNAININSPPPNRLQLRLLARNANTAAHPS